MTDFFEWAVLILAVATIICMTQKYWWAPIIGFIQEIAWFGYAICVGSVPLFITAVIFTVIYGRAIPKWYKEKR